jgi:hypothetical protein
MCLTGTASQVTAGATAVWQFGQLQEDGVNRPANVPGWIRYQIDPVPCLQNLLNGDCGG